MKSVILLSVAFCSAYSAASPALPIARIINASKYAVVIQKKVMQAKSEHTYAKKTVSIPFISFKKYHMHYMLDENFSPKEALEVVVDSHTWRLWYDELGFKYALIKHELVSRDECKVICKKTVHLASKKALMIFCSNNSIEFKLID